MNSHHRDCRCAACQAIRSGWRDPHHGWRPRVREATRESNRRSEAEFIDDNYGGVQIINVNENDDHDHDHEYHGELIHRARSTSPDSGTPVETIELVTAPRPHGYPPLRNHHSWHAIYPDAHSQSSASGSASADGQLYGRQLAEQTQNITIRPEGYWPRGGGGGPGPGSWYWGRPWDPFGPPSDHWEVAKDRMRAKIMQEEIAVEEKIEKAILKYKDDEKQRKKDIQAAIDKHDLELADQKRREQAAIDAALRKKAEEKAKEKDNLELCYNHRSGIMGCDAKLWVTHRHGRKCMARNHWESPW